MRELLTKPFDSIGAEDIQRLIDTESEESILLELKGPLPAPSDRVDPWQAGENRILPFTRDAILSEIVGMANATGGLVVLGVNESEESPPRASDLFPLRDCVDLADRLGDQAWSCIDPRIPSLEVKGVPMAEDGSGAVLIRVRPSLRSPHGLSTTRRAYVRRGTSTESLFVREIQEMTLRSSTAAQELEQKLEGRRRGAQAILDRAQETGTDKLVVRISLLPTMTMPVVIDRAYQNEALFPPLRPFTSRIAGSEIILEAPTSVQDINNTAASPVLRGARRSSHEHDRFDLTHTVHGDGFVELLFAFGAQGGGAPIYSSWFLGLLANALVMADAVRQAAGGPGAQLVLDVEVGSWPSFPQLHGFEELRYMGVGDRESGTLEATPLRLPMYPIEDVTQFSDLMKRVMNDLREAAGLRAIEEFEVDFS